MYTSPPPLNVEFESDESKIELFSPGIVTLPAGSTAIITEIVDIAKAVLRGKSSPTVMEAAEALRAGYEQARLQKAEEQIAIPMVGHDFYNLRKTKGATLAQYLQAQPLVYQGIVAQMMQYSLGAEMIVAGLDSQGAKIAVITHPGSLYWLDKLGYGAVGSGAIHAVSTLNLSGQTRSHNLYETLYAVSMAKEAAQVAPGVGHVTDLAVIGDGGTFRACEKPILDELDRVRADTKKRSPPDLKALRDLYAKTVSK